MTRQYTHRLEIRKRKGLWLVNIFFIDMFGRRLWVDGCDCSSFQFALSEAAHMWRAWVRTPA